MNEQTKKLAEQAGFVMWSDCDWKPRGEVIDWASNYDEELEKFAELVRADEREACAKLAEEMERIRFDSVGDPRIRVFESQIAKAIRARGET